MKVTWHHDSPGEPVYLYSEIEERREVRKVEAYLDGTMDYADESGGTGTTFLSETLMPTTDEIAQDPQFTADSLTREEFEAVWRRAVGG